MSEPRVEATTYTVYPTGYDDLAMDDRYSWCLQVSDGMSFGWRVHRPGFNTEAMNRKGEFIWESRGSRSNRFRRYPRDEALALAAKYVDALTINGVTAQQTSEIIAARGVTP